MTLSSSMPMPMNAAAALPVLSPLSPFSPQAQLPFRAAAPQHYTAAQPRDAGLPGDRAARMAARRAFVDLKQTYLLALAGVTDGQGNWLRTQVRAAEEPVDLWLLRAPVFAALAGAEPERRRCRQMVRRGLDSVFADCEPASNFAPF